MIKHNASDVSKKYTYICAQILIKNKKQTNLFLNKQVLRDILFLNILLILMIFPRNSKLKILTNQFASRRTFGNVKYSYHGLVFACNVCNFFQKHIINWIWIKSQFYISSDLFVFKMNYQLFWWCNVYTADWFIFMKYHNFAVHLNCIVDQGVSWQLYQGIPEQSNFWWAIGLLVSPKI